MFTLTPHCLIIKLNTRNYEMDFIINIHLIFLISTKPFDVLADPINKALVSISVCLFLLQLQMALSSTLQEINVLGMMWYWLREQQ
jgi:hypothetical protein